MGIGMIVLVIAAVVLVVYLIRSMTVTTVQTHPAAHYPQAQGAPYATQLPAAQAAMETPRDIVQRRYASGEIDREEYLQKLKDV